MLIEKNLFAPDTKIVLRLVTGEEIIATVENETATEIHVRRPFRLTAHQQGFALVPMTMISEEDCRYYFLKSQITAYYALHSSVEIEYIKASSTIAIV